MKINGPEIVVEYRGDVPGGWLRYVGREDGAGHYRLTCPERRGNATLHRFKDSDILDGFWSEDGQIGMWRIQISDEE